nr:RNA-directed DNA polymerase, eukaryota, reverse transcriptase zinc-binding domain protein [Tanacetum cinerariifolium]
ELFHQCKRYGHVVDAYIPVKRMKVGKRFGFVRFINVFSEERLMTFRGKLFWICAKEIPGWTPDLLEEFDDEDDILKDGSMEGDNKEHDSGSNDDNSDVEVGSGGGVGCVVVVPVVERQRSEVGGGVVLAAWVVVLAVVRRTLPEKWRRRGSEVTRWWWCVKESGVEDRVDRETRNLFGFAEKIPPKKFSGGGWPAGYAQVELECEVTKEELKQAMWDCGSDKSPGPDGFSFGFYRQFWATIENDVFKAVKHFFMYADIPKGYIVSDVQSAFIKGRQILDGPFILTEVTHWCKSKKKQSLIFKVDFEKAFDSVRWDFLDDVLKKFGFGNKWCEWIQKCLKSSRGFIIINGSPIEEFQFFKGLKQGTKVGGIMSRSEAWNEVIEKVKSRLSKWKMKALSIGGRLTLLKSVLGLIPIFYMFIFRAPSSVLHNLESIRCQFFNGHEFGSRKASWVKWKYVLADKVNGGLGVSSIFALNRGLMIKWLWKFYDQKNSLWSNVIKAIHGNDGNVGLVRKNGVRSCWITIVNEVKELQKQGVNVLDCMRLKLGNGESASFWNDNWSGDGAAKDLYPRLFALENHKEVSVSSKLTDLCLDRSFRRSARGGVEQVQFDALVTLVSKVNLVPMDDIWVWSLEGSENLSVASIRKAIDANRLNSDQPKTRWVKYVPIKTNVLAWKIKMDALPTRLNISRRGTDIQSISCPICDDAYSSPTSSSSDNTTKSETVKIEAYSSPTSSSSDNTKVGEMARLCTTHCSSEERLSGEQVR